MAIHHLLQRGKLPSGYKVAARGTDAGEIYLYGPIGQNFWGEGISANQFRQDLKALGAIKTLDVRIMSEGGDVFEGKAIYQLLVEHKATVTMHIDGLAASAASFIAMAGNSIEIGEGAFMMIHNSWSVAMGNAVDMRRTADLLEAVDGTIVDVYAARTKQSADQIREWMADETWMDGKACVANGFADKMVANLAVAAAVRDPAMFRHLPAALRPKRVAASAAISAMRSTIGR